MNAFQLKEWWRYRRAAQGRHGVHSPFVYRFIEEGIRSSNKESLRERCISFLQKEGGIAPLLLSCEPATLETRFATAAPMLKKGAVILIHGIHKDAARLAMWRQCCANEQVNLSIELWDLGLLFFRADFKERQHFVLRHPA